MKKRTVGNKFGRDGGIQLKAALKTRKLLILLNEKNAKYSGIAQLRYTPGTPAKIPTYA